MPVLRLAFEDTESNLEIANRIARGLDPGDFIEIRGDLFRVYPGRSVRGTAGAPDKPVYQVVPLSHPIPPKVNGAPVLPATVEATVSKPTPEGASEAPTTSVLSVGQKWAPKDKRRQDQVITIVAVTETHVQTDGGRSIKKDRLRRYRLLG